MGSLTAWPLLKGVTAWIKPRKSEWMGKERERWSEERARLAVLFLVSADRENIAFFGRLPSGEVRRRCPRGSTTKKKN